MLGGLAVALALAGAGCGGHAPRATALPQSVCSDVFYGGKGHPRYLIVSDFPLRQGDYTATTRSMAAAVRFVIEQHRFKAGKYTIGYQSCDSSTAAADTFTIDQCVANAKAYAADSSVLGVVGPFNSSCAAVEIPVLNKTATGPLALISPSATDPSLTHVAAGTPSDTPARYYPSGVRSFVRVAASNDEVVAAGATLLRSLGATRVFVLVDSEPYGMEIGGIFRDVAPRAGLTVAGTATWDGQAKSYRRLAERIRHGRADGVFVAGVAEGGGDELVHDVRAVLGARAPLVAGDAFTFPAPRGSLRDGLYIATPQLDVSALPAAGRKIVGRFGPGFQPGLGPPYAAEAAEVLMDAIAKSDGTRASVTKDLLAEHVRSGYVGGFGFDQNGDVTPSRVMIYRVRQGRLTPYRVVVPAPATTSR